MAQTLHTTLARGDPELDDAEAHVGLELLAPHKTRLTAQRSALKPEHVATEDCHLLVVLVVTPLAWG